MREPPGPWGAGRLRCVCWAGRLRCVCWAGPLCVPVGGGLPRSCCPDRFPAAAWPVLLGRAAVCAGGRRPAREIATREPGGSEWSISKPGQAPPPPTGALHTGGAGCADDWLGVSSRSPARPCRRVACLVGPGLCVCRWAASRPRDRHTRASLGVVDLEARPGPMRISRRVR